MKKRIIIFLIICFLFVTGSSVAESVKLTALKPYFDGYIEINNKNITDSLGNRYSTYIRGYIQKKMQKSLTVIVYGVFKESIDDLQPLKLSGTGTTDRKIPVHIKYMVTVNYCILIHMTAGRNHRA